mmetsp:Transcript_775/g.1648  ORF Transcript_775/g.1648 Transcript_775/m.1648 type:complete len:508 (-) Transcript_775:80-1603(-)|eukprot:CAMPEP_0178416374 /NCGR_PEP_ID=MMETSP0689_2-20121128/24031_1 /TAXON_ID=160604 /ORGANISM="Amphidinium massartii, Strain CS-259" /LENGTH=507 /DNA_ID=CAMNT_0020037717 /DNA_START=66 /DNA_END=1589 /DNA_ORIENTATION=-
MAAPAAADAQKPEPEEEDGVLDVVAPYIAEFVGTGLLVFTVGVAGALASPLWAPLAIGFMLMIMMYNFGHVSGAHLNPAVSFSLALTGKASWGTALSYSIVQIIAGICAGLCLHLFRSEGVPDHVKEGYRGLHVAYCEVIYTMLLCFVIICTCAAKRSTFPYDGNHYGSFAAGLALAGAAYVSSPVSGRITFNPAASIGFDVGLGFFYPGGNWVGFGLLLCVYQLGGAILAAIFFRLVHPEDFKEDLDYPEILRYRPRLPALLVSEFVGTFVVSFTIVLGVVIQIPVALVAGAAVYAAVVYALINVSGAHCNPAITLAVVFSWRALLTPLLGLGYLVVQIAAASCAGLLAASVHKSGPTNARDATELLWPKEPFTWWGVATTEGFFTMLMAFAMLTVATTEPSVQSLTAHSFPHGLAIGFVMLVGSISVGSVSSGMFNPAVAFAIGMDSSVSHTWFYPCLYNSMFQLAGGAVAAVLELITHGHTMRKKRREAALADQSADAPLASAS